jgi:hypothetical protein
MALAMMMAGGELIGCYGRIVDLVSFAWWHQDQITCLPLPERQMTLYQWLQRE